MSIHSGTPQALEFLEQLLVYDPKKRLSAPDAAAVSDLSFCASQFCASESDASESCCVTVQYRAV